MDPLGFLIDTLGSSQLFKEVIVCCLAWLKLSDVVILNFDPVLLDLLHDTLSVLLLLDATVLLVLHDLSCQVVCQHLVVLDG